MDEQRYEVIGHGYKVPASLGSPEVVDDRYEVDPKYFTEKYNMPVGARRNAQVPVGGEEDDDKKRQNNAHPFFD